MPRPTKTIFGKPALVLPNIFQYGNTDNFVSDLELNQLHSVAVSFIKSVDGFYGCYRGLSPKIVGNIITSHFSERIADDMGMVKVDETEKDDMTEEEYEKRYITQLKRSVVVHAAGVIISSPFHVISIRMMAQFVGRETKYTSILRSIVQIYKDEGIFGFFSGVIPRLIFDVTCVIAASTATFLVGRHFIREREGRAYFGSLSSVSGVGGVVIRPVNH